MMTGFGFILGEVITYAGGLLVTFIAYLPCAKFMWTRSFGLPCTYTRTSNQRNGSFCSVLTLQEC